MMLFTTLSVSASRALSLPVSVTQPDGTTITITLCGDVHFAWIMLADGTLVEERDKAYYVATIDAQGNLQASDQLAHEQGQRTLREQLLCKEQRQYRDVFFERGNDIRQAGRRAQVTSTGYLPHKDSPKCLVILVNFSDKSFVSDDPKAQFEQYFNGDTQQNLGHNEQKNILGVKKYFEQSSQGKFSPQFDIVGPYTLPQTVAYYGKNSGSSKDVNFGQFCTDAIGLADAEVDFRDYDNNNDGHAELVCVIYAGSGESVSGNPANTIWPKCSGRNISTKDDGVVVNYINCSPELYFSDSGDINGIGLFCHEFSHGMGLPDLYATVTAAQIDNQSPEFWDLMDYGEYGGNGYAPVPYTAWEQEAMGWIEIEQLSQSQKDIEMNPLVRGGKAYKFGNGANAEEWIIIENMQQRNNAGGILGSSYGHGLLAMHVAYAKSTVAMGDNPNNTPGTPRVCIVPADGLVINGYRFVTKGSDGEYHPTTTQPYTQPEYVASLRADPFPGTNDVTMLSAEMELPNSKFYNGTATLACKLENIREDETTGVVTFDFNDGTTTAITSLEAVQADNAYYTLDGRRMQGSPTRSGLYIHKGKLFVNR